MPRFITSLVLPLLFLLVFLSGMPRYSFACVPSCARAFGSQRGLSIHQSVCLAYSQDQEQELQALAQAAHAEQGYDVLPPLAPPPPTDTVRSSLSLVSSQLIMRSYFRSKLKWMILSSLLMMTTIDLDHRVHLQFLLQWAVVVVISDLRGRFLNNSIKRTAVYHLPCPPHLLYHPHLSLSLHSKVIELLMTHMAFMPFTTNQLSLPPRPH